MGHARERARRPERASSTQTRARTHHQQSFVIISSTHSSSSSFSYSYPHLPLYSSFFCSFHSVVVVAVEKRCFDNDDGDDGGDDDYGDDGYDGFGGGDTDTTNVKAGVKSKTQRITIFKSVGTSIQDVVTSGVVFQNAQLLNIGTLCPL